MFNPRLNAIEDIIISNITESSEFREFCSDLDQLSLLVSPELYLEKVIDRNNHIKNTAEKITKNTVNSTRQVASVYNDITDANANVIKSLWDLFMKSVQLTTKVLTFALNKISLVPKMILSVTNKMINLPNDIKNKIKGNIKLYVTVEDIYDLYNKNIFRMLDQFMADADIVVKGDMWGTFFNRRSNKNGGQWNLKDLTPGANDMAALKKMNKVYGKLKLVEFQQTTIDMSNPKNVDIYLGNSKSINFTDLSGNKHECTYYEALHQFMKDLEKEKERLENLQKSIGEKYDNTRMNQNFGSLSPIAQKRITDTIVMISKMVNIIGNLVRYITIDMNELSTGANKILKERKIKNN